MAMNKHHCCDPACSPLLFSNVAGAGPRRGRACIENKANKKKKSKKKKHKKETEDETEEETEGETKGEKSVNVWELIETLRKEAQKIFTGQYKVLSNSFLIKYTL